ncbi:MAG: hypothetical protein AAF570_19040, partial [Bacteroidota bacterium]
MNKPQFHLFLVALAMLAGFSPSLWAQTGSIIYADTAALASWNNNPTLSLYVEDPVPVSSPVNSAEHIAALRLFVDHNSMTVPPPFDLEADIDISYGNGNTAANPAHDSKTLTLSAVGNGKWACDVRVVGLDPKTQIRIDVTRLEWVGSGGLPVSDNVYLELMMQVQRCYDPDILFDYLSPPSTFAISSTRAGGLVQIAWDEIEGAAAYDLEWTFVDDILGRTTNGNWIYKPSGQLRYDFGRNSTRVKVKDAAYSFPDVFEHGYLLYRVRPW